MKKVFTLLFGLLGLAGTLQAATIDEVNVCKHSYVFVADEVTNNGTVKPATNTLVGDGYFLLCGSDKTKTVAANKGTFDLSVVDGELVTEEIAAKYGEYGSHLNSLRLKLKQDVIGLKVTANSKVIVFYENNNVPDKRFPHFCTEPDNTKTFADQGTRVTGTLNSKGVGRAEWIAPDDVTLYICAGDQIHVSYIIVEAKEAPGTPQVKVGAQTYAEGLWYREVTCKPTIVDGLPTVVTYTTDGTEPTAASTVYKEPIKCYKDQIVKFQAYIDAEGNSSPIEELKAEGADYEVPVSFSFDAPALTADGATFTITSPYEGAKNYYSVDGAEAVEGNGTTLTESATVTAYTQIVNGEYTTFTTKSVTQDVYVLDPVKVNKTLLVTGTAVVDEEATAESTTGTVYKVENASVDYDKKDFFFKDVEYAAIANADAAKAKYQSTEGQEAYIKMNNTRISFSVAAGDSVDVIVVCSKNSCKNIDETDEDVNAENSKVADNRKCFINVDGTNYGGVDLKLNPEGNIVKFGLGAGIHTFQKYSGTGNILVSSINIIPVDKSAIDTLRADEAQTAAKKVFSNGRLVIKTAQGTFNAAGILVK